MTKKIMLAVFLLLGLAMPALADDVAFRFAGQDFLIPLKVVSGSQLYSFKKGKGYPALETALWSKGKWQAGIGAAAVLGTDINVPFGYLQTRLSAAVFDTSNNDLRFGVWAGKPSGRADGEAKWIFGIKASTPLW